MNDALIMFLMTIAAMGVGVLFVVATIKLSGERLYDVFAFGDDRLTVLAGIPVSYRISDIKEITFSKMIGRQGSYTGVIRIVKQNGRKSRPFLFDGSAYHKRFALYTDERSLALATQALMEALREHGIACSQA